jgi:sugar/nucleoside kinase (ribokinase family)
MNKIYGFGNALIDIEIRISEDQLKNISIPKGSMRHISVDELEDLLKRFNSQRHSAMPGGSIANSLHAANKHDAEIYFSCSIGDDAFGELFIDSFKLINESVSFYKSSLPTGICLIFVTPDGERTMAANLGANLDLCPESLNVDILRVSDFLLFDNFSLSFDKGVETTEYSLSLENELNICFGISDKSLVKKNNSKIKKVFLNEIHLLYGNEYEIKEFEKLISKPALNTLISKGSAGASYNQEFSKAPRIDIVNSNGAGDALIGTFLAYFGIIDKKDALKKAVSYATEICTVSSPRLDI